MPTNKTVRWKNLEKNSAKLLQRFLIPANRITRGNDYSVSLPDVEVVEHNELKIDCKYSVQNFKTTTMLAVVRSKYCKEKLDFPVLICKGYKQMGSTMVLEGDFAAMILSYWLGYGTKEELLKIYNKVDDEREYV